jgi:hypothetical protein
MDPVQNPAPVNTMPPINASLGGTQTTTVAVASKKSYGPIIGAVIIFAVLVFGALYFWGESINKNQAEELPLILGNDPAHPTVTQTVPAGASTDSVDQIEADLNAASTDSMSASVDASLKQAEGSM